MSTPPVPAARRAVRHRRAAVLAALALLVLTACGYGSKAKDDPGAEVAVGAHRIDGLESVRIGYLANLTHATALVGHRKGFFQKALGATKAQYATFNAGPSEIEALSAGSIDIAWIGPSPAVNAFTRSQGKNLRIIGGSASGGVKLVVDPDTITSLQDVEGKRIATPQLGNTQDVAFLNWAAQQGWSIDPHSGKGDVSVARTDNKIIPDAYRSGSIDGAWVPEPTASKLVAEGGRVLLDERSLWPGNTFVTTHIIVSRTFLAHHPQAVEAVLKASVDTNKWINTHPAQAKHVANQQLAADSGKALPATVLDPAWESIDITDDPLAATLRTQAEHAAHAGLLDHPALNGIYDLTLLNKILCDAGENAVDAAGLGAAPPCPR
ncbi:aliphatic sulfonate ABC transporter substrate-binding protein [Streptomyces sp. NPDC088766]|uniref:aliphatic sulfonate ABC transporter substrate-binding protein n=1 Tax=Streptomyces sp. NPDC088766 TaxID=3365893 RepID=UPI00382D6247